jgi:hypothetical protein
MGARPTNPGSPYLTLTIWKGRPLVAYIDTVSTVESDTSHISIPLYPSVVLERVLVRPRDNTG